MACNFGTGRKYSTVLDEATGIPLAAAAVVVHPDGRYLLVKRAEAASAGGYWTPVTGKIDPGESLEQAVVREVQEEVGLRVGVGAELYRCPTHNGQWMLVWCEAPLLGSDDFTLHLDEVQAARWVTASEAVKLEPMFDDTRDFYAARRVREDEC